jgi:polyphosphate kinase
MLELLTDLPELLQTAANRRQSLEQRLCALGRLAATVDEQLSQPYGGPLINGLQSPLVATVADLLLQASLVLHSKLFSLLPAQGVQLTPVSLLNERQQIWLNSYFLQHIYPLLTPLAVDSGRPFPYISSGSLNLLALLHPGFVDTGAAQAGISLRTTRQSALFARVKIPRMIARFIAIPSFAPPFSGPGPVPQLPQQLVWSEDIVRHFAHHLFPGMTISGIYQFRLLRVGEVSGGWPNGALADNNQLAKAERDKAKPVVWLEAEHAMPAAVLRWLTEHVQFPLPRVFRCTPPLRIASLLELAQFLSAK